MKITKVESNCNIILTGEVQGLELKATIIKPHSKMTIRGTERILAKINFPTWGEITVEQAEAFTELLNEAVTETHKLNKYL